MTEPSIETLREWVETLDAEGDERLRGAELGSLDRLVRAIVRARGISPVEVLFGEIEDEAVRRAAELLYRALRLAVDRHAAGEFLAFHLPDGVEDEDDRIVLALVRAVLPDWDPLREIADAEVADAGWREENLETLLAEEGDPARRGGPVDDDVPF
jgi:hypothetical protein